MLNCYIEFFHLITYKLIEKLFTNFEIQKNAFHFIDECGIHIIASHVWCDINRNPWTIFVNQTAELLLKSNALVICCPCNKHHYSMINNRALFQHTDYLSGIGIPIIKIRWSSDHLFFILVIFILVRRYVYIEMGPRNPHAITINLRYIFLIPTFQ